MATLQDRRREVASMSLVHALIATAIRAEIDVQAAQIAFNAVFSLGPLLALTTTALSLVRDESVREGFRAHVLPFAPNAVRPWLESQVHLVQQAPSAIVLCVSIIALLWSVGSTTGAIATALGHVGWRLRTTWIARKLTALLLGFTLVIAMVLAAIGASVGPRVFDWVGRFVPHIEAWESFVAWLRWPVVGLVFGSVAALIFRLATIERPLWRIVFVGGFWAGLVNIGASALLSVYLAFAPSMGAWGAAAGVFATLLWLWILAIGLLFGAVIAYVLDARRTVRQEELITRRAKHRTSFGLTHRLQILRAKSLAHSRPAESRILRNKRTTSHRRGPTRIRRHRAPK
jgi:uncharacterized BrkB/YihY/UPF0761 family membrane protein